MPHLFFRVNIFLRFFLEPPKIKKADPYGIGCADLAGVAI